MLSAEDDVKTSPVKFSLSSDRESHGDTNDGDVDDTEEDDNIDDKEEEGDVGDGEDRVEVDVNYIPEDMEEDDVNNEEVIDVEDQGK